MLLAWDALVENLIFGMSGSLCRLSIGCSEATAVVLQVLQLQQEAAQLLMVQFAFFLESNAQLKLRACKTKIVPADTYWICVFCARSDGALWSPRATWVSIFTPRRLRSCELVAMDMGGFMESEATEDVPSAAHPSSTSTSI
jgi:hypothetical protein